MTISFDVVAAEQNMISHFLFSFDYFDNFDISEHCNHITVFFKCHIVITMIQKIFDKHHDF